MTIPDQIKQLHRLYCERTGFEIGLNFVRERQWYEWLQWRPGKPFDAQDLARVIGFIRQGIHKGERNEGALKFTNLIGNPDRFEEDLGLAVKSIKPAGPAKTVSTYKPLPEVKPEDRLQADEFSGLFAGIRRPRSGDK